MAILGTPIDNIIMLAVGCLFIYLAIKKGYEPLLLIPIGFGAILVNIPPIIPQAGFPNLMDENRGILYLIYCVGFTAPQAFSLVIIGAMDGPTAIFVASTFAPSMLAAISVCAYSYMSLVPILQIPISKALTTT